MYTVRKARLDEAQAIIDLHSDTLRRVNTRDYAPEQIEIWIGVRKIEITEAAIRKGEHWVCVDERGTIIGESLMRGEEIFGLYVSADRQGQGIGSLLLNEMEAQARKGGVMALVLTSMLTAVPFYLSRGFREQERVIVGRTRLEVVKMRKQLPATEHENPPS